jgi:hypothetical protein
MTIGRAFHLIDQILRQIRQRSRNDIWHLLLLCCLIHLSDSLRQLGCRVTPNNCTKEETGRATRRILRAMLRCQLTEFISRNEL